MRPDISEGFIGATNWVENLEESRGELESTAVYARASCADQAAVIVGLRHLGYTVATVAKPEISRFADIGISSAPQSPEIECDIYLTSSEAEVGAVISAIAWGRNLLANVRKFIQFALVVNLVILFLCFLGAIILGRTPINAI
jgi:magnesium-transporting ATPase (P-type)